MVFRNNNNVYVCNYDETLLKTFPATVNITPTTVKSGKKEIALYSVDDTYYLYENGKFEIAPIEERELYITTYESPYGTVVVNSYNEQEHDEACQTIEKCEDKEFNQTPIVSHYLRRIATPKFKKNIQH